MSSTRLFRFSLTQRYRSFFFSLLSCSSPSYLFFSSEDNFLSCAGAAAQGAQQTRVPAPGRRLGLPPGQLTA